MADRFTWIPVYGEIARRLLDWEPRQGELIAFLEELRQQGLKVTPLSDKDEDGGRHLLKEIDPFTFFGVFNRGIKNEQRLAILTAIKKLLNAENALPSDFDGLPLLNNLRSWFVAYESERKESDVKRLWRVFKLALGENPLKDPEFKQAFDEALEVKCTNLNLTMGLFWIRPDTFLGLDQNNRDFLNIKLPSTGLSGQFYVDTVFSVLAKGQPLQEVSRQAWAQATQIRGPGDSQGSAQEPKLPSENSFWMVGAYWSGHDPQDLTQQFLDEGIWQNGYKDRWLNEVRSMRVGDRIAIKAASTQRHNLPFDTRGKTISRMTIKAIGTVVANRGDGRTVEVEWDPSFAAKDWYFYTNQQTVWHLRRDNEFAQRLIDFAFGNAKQDYDWFCQQWWGSLDGEDNPPREAKELGLAEPYSLADVVASGTFMGEDELAQVLDRLRSKMNLVLQGPPGVGKNFLARKLAYALLEEKDDQRIKMVQFHQSYSYEDFIRGYRPGIDKAGTFDLVDGVFYEFCKVAKDDLDRPYVFIIDEINRGNLSQIFGELLMLIEADKRGPENTVPLVYRKKNEPGFYVPQNLYLIGLMNVADRSLAMVDYALRRRFAFLELSPKYESERFRSWLQDREMNTALLSLIIERLTSLNKEISDDPLLGQNYQLGHSFFCPKGDNFEGLDRTWYEGIVKTEIIPLLREYWFDNPQRVKQAQDRLLAS